MTILLISAASYLIGSIPTAYIITKMLKGIDIRTVGSGNVGATNVFRAAGRKAGSATLILDMLKGTVCVALAHSMHGYFGGCPVETAVLFAFVFSIVGHTFTVFLNFRGGKGVATAAGALAGIDFSVFAVAIIVWVVVFLCFRYVSLASVIAVSSTAVAAFIVPMPAVYRVVFICTASIVVIRHKSNLLRLRNGTEPKVIFRRKE